MAARSTHDNGNGTSLQAWDDGGIQVRCNDCGRWAYEGKPIVHSTRCDTPQAQHTASPQASTPARQPRTANGLSSDELLAAVQRRYLTSDQAMNRDF